MQLWLASVPLGLIIALLLHPQFWGWVGRHIWWPLSTVLMLLWHIMSQVLLNTYVTDGKRIKKPFVWLFSYVALSAGYCVVRALLSCSSLRIPRVSLHVCGAGILSSAGRCPALRSCGAS